MSKLKKCAVAQIAHGTPVAMFESRFAGSKATGVDVAAIRKVCARKRTHAGGYSWSDVDIEKQAQYKKNCGWIVQRDKETNTVLGMYSSFPLASKLTGIKNNNIKQNVLGARKSAGGYVWSMV